MRTELDDDVMTEIGSTRVRTLSHYLLLKKPRTTIFSNANPYSEDTMVTILWNTSDADTLQELHRRLVTCVSEHGFAPIKEASRSLNSNEETKIAAGKIKLLMLVSPEVGAHVTFVG
jgi:hypothetical protein